MREKRNSSAKLIDRARVVEEQATRSVFSHPFPNRGSPRPSDPHPASDSGRDRFVGRRAARAARNLFAEHPDVPGRLDA
jgi:hypothetical protein